MIKTSDRPWLRFGYELLVTKDECLACMRANTREEAFDGVSG